MIIPVSHKYITVTRLTRTKVTFHIGTQDIVMKVGDTMAINRNINVTFADLVAVRLFGKHLTADIIEHKDVKEINKKFKKGK